MLDDVCPCAMRPFGVLADRPPWFEPKKPFGCGLTFDVKLGVIKANDVLSETNKREILSGYYSWNYHNFLFRKFMNRANEFFKS